MVTYEEVDQNTIDLLNEIKAKEHTDLPEDIRIGMLFAFDVDREGNITEKPPIKNQGYPASAKIQIVKLKDRFTKNLDVEILIDGEFWKYADEPTKRAILDHELEHLEFTGDRDDLDRPKLKLKKDDFCVWGFTSIIKRHGEAAQELKCFNALRDKILQITNE